MQKKEQFIHMRIEPASKLRYKSAARASRLKLSQWIEQTLDEKLTAIKQAKDNGRKE